MLEAPRRPPLGRRWLASAFRHSPLKQSGHALYGLAASGTQRLLSGVPGVIEARCRSESIATCVPVVSDLDWLIRVRDADLAATARQTGRRFLRARRLFPMLGEVLGSTERLEWLCRREGASLAFHLNWPNPVDIGSAARVGLAVEFYLAAWNRWLLGVRESDKVFHERAIARAALKARAVLGAPPPDASPDPDVRLADLFRALAEFGARHPYQANSRFGAISAPEAAPFSAVAWRAQYELWRERVPVYSDRTRWEIRGAAVGEEPCESGFWRALRSVLARSPSWYERYAPLPLPGSIAPYYLAGRRGSAVSDSPETLEIAAAVRAVGDLPPGWGIEAAASFRDRLLFRVGGILGLTLSGNRVPAAALACEGWALGHLAENGLLPDPGPSPDHPTAWVGRVLDLLERTSV